ncbi:MAG: malto-oligosyltrehalose trehalohydrolase [Chitinophagaceae bacterium]|nr:malto-oligosyltrehalose trehalohydrolase [Chitinophagaceae bacterium]
MKTAGANFLGNNKCIFTVWAPEKEKMFLHLVSPVEKKIEMTCGEYGYFSVELNDVSPGCRYFFMPEGEKDFPDPASFYQPEGVHGPSEVIDHYKFNWTDNSWRGIPFRDIVLYELHVGTFSEEGSFESAIPLLDDLVETGINAIELMPVSQFPGTRNWGYDGVYPYAVQHSYGGPEGLKKLVDACHQKGIAIFLDVVYNHLGPEGNYLEQFGPYFTDRYQVPWGKSFNFDGEWSDGVREYFCNNTLYWFSEFHIDGLRLDAVHTIFDNGAVNIWELMYERIKLLEQQLGRKLYMTAESDYNSPKVIKVPEAGGLGFDAQWLDDFHHALYVLLDRKGIDRYADYGLMEQLAKAYTEGFVHSGEFVNFRKRKHGTSSAGIQGDKFIAFNLNHDQVGNRVGGERLSLLVNFERLKLAAAALLLSPYVPLLFMGEEYAEDERFFFFCNYSDKNLIEGLKKSREKEFEKFKTASESFPDPVDEATFTKCKLKWEKRKQGKYKTMLEWYKALITFRRTNLIMQDFCKNNIKVYTLKQDGFILHRQRADGKEHLLCLFNLSEKELQYSMPVFSEEWEKIIDSTEAKWNESAEEEILRFPALVGSGANITMPPLSVCIYGSRK